MASVETRKNGPVPIYQASPDHIRLLAFITIQEIFDLFDFNDFYFMKSL
jgi:hypothetical protein